MVCKLKKGFLLLLQISQGTGSNEWRRGRLNLEERAGGWEECETQWIEAVENMLQAALRTNFNILVRPLMWDYSTQMCVTSHPFMDLRTGELDLMGVSFPSECDVIHEGLWYWRCIQERDYGESKLDTERMRSRGRER